MSTPIVVFGVGGFGREVHEMLVDMIRHGSDYDILGFLDGNEATHGTEVHGLPVLGGPDWTASHPGISVALGLGGPVAKRKVVNQFESMSVSFPTLVSPRAWVGEYVTVGRGSIVCAGTVVTTDVEVGDFCTLNLNVTVGHDVKIGSFSTLAPATNVSGYVQFGEGCETGTNVSLIPSVSVGEWSIVGAGAVVTRDLPANVTAVGSPAKAIKEREPGWHLQ